MRLRIHDPIVLAIDLRHRRLGYAVYEGHRRLREAGQRVYRAVGEEEAMMASRRLSHLIKSFSPSAIVIKQERWKRAEVSPHMRTLIEVTSKVAAMHNVAVVLIADENVRQTFHNLGCETRDETAAALARIFPELSWKLPPKRRAWQSEHPRMAMFDAVALGLAYWQHEAKALPVPPP